jgi:trimeric autotransporter adhesin
LNQWNVNIQREFHLTERVRFQIRGDAINLQNRSQFNAPDLNPLSTNFGRITSQTDGTNRFIQIQGRIRF